MKKLQVTVSDTIADAVAEHAKNTGKKASALCREAIVAYLVANGFAIDMDEAQISVGTARILETATSATAKKRFEAKLRARMKKARQALRERREKAKKEAEKAKAKNAKESAENLKKCSQKMKHILNGKGTLKGY